MPDSAAMTRSTTSSGSSIRAVGFFFFWNILFSFSLFFFFLFYYSSPFFLHRSELIIFSSIRQLVQAVLFARHHRGMLGRGYCLVHCCRLCGPRCVRPAAAGRWTRRAGVRGREFRLIRVEPRESCALGFPA